MGVTELVLIGLAAVAGGMVNALAGGGTLITFPMLTATGIPALSANVTNTVALCPGYLGAAFAQMSDLRGQERRLLLLLPISIVGGVLGGILLLFTGERTFRMLVPFLILLASFLLAVQEPLRRRIFAHTGRPALSAGWTTLPVLPAAVYGGYFGAGVSVIVLAVLGLFLNDSLTRLNALKQAISLGINVAAAIFLIFSGRVIWDAALVMALGALVGGVLGGRLASRINPVALRRIVVSFGVVVALIYFIR
jgi:uncharacterized membrane protein YfcA